MEVLRHVSNKGYGEVKYNSNCNNSLDVLNVCLYHFVDYLLKL